MSVVSKKNAVVYCRVSTKEQADNFSLANQKRACQEHAERYGYAVVRGFVNKKGESAKTANRDALQQLLKFVSEEHRNIRALIIWKYDRLARNMVDYANLHAFFTKLGIEVISVTEPADSSAMGKFTKNIMGVMAQLDNDVRSERTVAGMKQAMREGRWVWNAPFGYSYKKDYTGRPILVPDKNAPLVVEAFALMEKGIHKQTDVCRTLRRKGADISKQRLSRILRNPAYAGLIIREDWFEEPIKAVHEALVSKATYDRVQSVLNGKRPGLVSRQRNHPDFPLRNFVFCPVCKKPITGSFSTGRNGVRHPYYHCRKSGCGFGSVKKDILHEKFVNLLRSVQPSAGVVRLFREVVKDVWKSSEVHQEKERKQLQKRLRQIKEKQKKAMDHRMDGDFTRSEYRGYADEFARQATDIEAGLSELGDSNVDMGNCVDYCARVLLNGPDLWRNADLDLRQRFQSFVFPSGFEYFKGSIGTAETAIVFKLLRESKTGKSNMATPTGLEPVLPP